jgi:hypothetical protein
VFDPRSLRFVVKSAGPPPGTAVKGASVVTTCAFGPSTFAGMFPLKVTSVVAFAGITWVVSMWIVPPVGERTWSPVR